MMVDLHNLLQEQLTRLEEAATILRHSYARCREIGIKADYVLEELDQIEAFTSRFARMSDLLIQRIFRLIDRIDLEDEGTVRDRINRAERKELIASAAEFTEIRILRNQIAHEYLPDAMAEIYENVFNLCPRLFDSVERVKTYCQRFRTDETAENQLIRTPF